MKKIIIIIICLFQTIACFPQEGVNPLKADITNNGEMDLLVANDTTIRMNIDKRKYKVALGDLGFEDLSELSFAKKVLTIAGGNGGSGAFSWKYKFRYNAGSQKIELIGFDSFSKWVSGSISKSINLLTGSYEISLESYNYEKDKMDTTKYTGKKIFPKIILTELTETSFDDLNELGHEYAPQ